MATERPGTSYLHMNALATPAICSRSGPEISSSTGDPPHAPAPEIGIARTEAERMRFIATLLVTAGMKGLPDRRKQLQHLAISNRARKYSNATRHRQTRGEYTRYFCGLRHPTKALAASRRWG